MPVMDDTMSIPSNSAIWVPDDGRAWTEGRMVKLVKTGKGFDLTYMTEDEPNKVKTVLMQDSPPLRNTTLNESRLDDLTELTHLNEPAVLNTIRQRYLEDEIYTYSGLVLVSVNPYRKLDLYSSELIWTFKGRLRADLEPHLFAVAEEAHQSLTQDARSQSIIVSGESGAGKTISAKYIMRYLAEICKQGSDIGGVESKILATNPILEAFGNAKTARNDNSSRFGKYVQILFNRENQIVGASIRTFLLEKTRVVSHGESERNYHIFYQLLAGLKQADLDSLGLDPSPSSYAYLGKRNAMVDGVDDAIEFELTRESLSLAGFSHDQQWSIFSILSAILHIGNISLSKDSQDYAIVDAEDKYLHSACRLLEIDPIAFAKWLVKRKIKAGNDEVETQLTLSQAISTRDSISRHLYDLLFTFIISSLNRALRPAKLLDSMHFIGVLDIYGFEKFDRNSFEQFCINYANEKLQYQFNQQVFRLEQALYESEGITWSFINFNDNQPCIEMIEGRQGILRMLAEECRVPNGSDKQLGGKINQAFDDSLLGRNKFNRDEQFTVKHFAYDVPYDVEGFLEKNRDSFPEEQLTLLRSSKNAFISLLFEESAEDVTSSSMSKSGSKDFNSRETGKNTGLAFKASLNELMDLMGQTQVHYIRCIKPNQSKEPLLFNSPFVVQQLRACGIIETIRISAAGFPGRWSFADFIARYRILSPEVRLPCNDEIGSCRKILETVELGDDDYQVGKTKVFLRAGVLGRLEEERTHRLLASAMFIQTASRAHRQRAEYQKTRSAISFLQQAGRIALAKTKFLELKKDQSALIISCAFKRLKAINRLRTASCQSTLLTSTWRMYSDRLEFIKHQKNAQANLIVASFKGWLQRRANAELSRASSTISMAGKMLLAKRNHGLLKAESRSVAKLLETSSSLERKILDLSTKLQISELALIDAERALTETKDVLVKAKDSAHREQQDLRTKIAQLNTELQSLRNQLHVFEQSELEYSEKINQLENSLDDEREKRCSLEEELDAMRKQLASLKSTVAKQRQEHLSSDKRPLVDRTMSTTEFILSHDETQRESPKASGHHLRKLSMDSKLSHLSDLDLPRITTLLGPRKRLDQASKEEMSRILNDTKLIEELHELALCSAGYDPRKRQGGEEGPISRLPAIILEHWVSTWLELEPEPIRLADQFHNLLGTIKNLCLRSLHANEGPLTSDQKYAFWLGNLVQLLGALQYKITKYSNTMGQGAPPNLVVVDTSQHESGMTTPLLVLLQMRSEAARTVEELYRNWLAELCKWFSKLGPAAIMDHQGLAGYAAEADRGTSSSSRFINNILGRRSSTNPQLSTEVLLDSLDELVNAMISAELQSELAVQLLNGVMAQIFAIAFNEMLMRKSYATWRRGIQIQYNLSQLEDWASRLRLDRPDWISGPPIPFSEPLLQAVKLLQLAKTATTEDIPVILEACPSLNTHQIRRILSVYVPDEFEDGPVSPQLMRALALRCQQDELSEQPHDLMMPEVKPDADPLQLSIKPALPNRLNVPVSAVPPTLWKLFILVDAHRNLS